VKQLSFANMAIHRLNVYRDEKFKRISFGFLRRIVISSTITYYYFKIINATPMRDAPRRETLPHRAKLAARLSIT